MGTTRLQVQRTIPASPEAIFSMLRAPQGHVAAEYWGGDGALLHQDPKTGDDLAEDGLIRACAFSGTDHFGAGADQRPFAGGRPGAPARCDPLLWALFRRLEEWVCDGTAPPPSAVPRRADASAVDRVSVLRCVGAAALADVDGLPSTPGWTPGPRPCP